jgi:hypothetical protein
VGSGRRRVEGRGSGGRYKCGRGGSTRRDEDNAIEPHGGYESPMFCKHFYQILVTADLDVHFSLCAEIEQAHYVTVVMRILVNHISNQPSEMSAISIQHLVQCHRT